MLQVITGDDPDGGDASRSVLVRLRSVQDLLFEHGINICHETVQLSWRLFGLMFAGDIQRQRVSRMRGFRHRKRRLGEVYVKINGDMHYLWRAVDQEGEILES